MEEMVLADRLGAIHELWRPGIVAELKGQEVERVKLRGEFVGHHHEVEDELFPAIAGRMRIEFRDRVVELAAGEGLVVPRGVERRPVADEAAAVPLLEPAGVGNTGDVVDERPTAPDGVRF